MMIWTPLPFLVPAGFLVLLFGLLYSLLRQKNKKPSDENKARKDNEYHARHQDVVVYHTESESLLAKKVYEISEAGYQIIATTDDGEFWTLIYKEK